MATSTRRSEAAWIESKGYWEIKVQKQGTRKSFRSSIKGRKGKHAAEAKADVWLETGTEQMRFDAAWEQYLAFTQKNTGTGNYAACEQQGRMYLLPRLQAKKLANITQADWQRCITEMATDRELSARTCKNVVSTITSFISYCNSENWDVSALQKALTIPRSATPEKEKIILQPEALRTLFEDASYPYRGKTVSAWYINAWRFYVVTGLRRGELAGLRREDVVGGVLSVRRSINKFQEVTRGKNDNARRDMRLSKIALSILREQDDMLMQNDITSPWVFPDKHGECSDPNLIYKHWVKYVEHHSLDHCTIQGMRRTFVSINKVDTPLELIKMLVGHSVDMDTIGVYGREVSGEKELAAQYVDSAFEKVLSAQK